MKKSNFQFTKPVVKRFEFVVHDDFVVNDDMKIENQVDVEIQRQKLGEEVYGNEATVAVSITIGRNDSKTPFYIRIIEEANFRWKLGVFDEEGLENLLNKNAVALLISYARPIIATITNSSPYPAYDLPYFDLSGNEE